MWRTAREPVLGIDEAGRGAWIGPLVVGAVCVRRDEVRALIDAGARDSKALSPARREEVYERLARCAVLRSAEAAPAEIDRHVTVGKLNELEARLFGELARPFAPAEARVDACDTNARRFGARVAHFAGPEVAVFARHHADATDPVVGAASIVAKVRRDRAIRQLAADLGTEVGSGYPSDPRTVEFVRRYVAEKGDLPSWLRASWATTRRVIARPRAGPARPPLR